MLASRIFRKYESAQSGVGFSELLSLVADLGHQLNDEECTLAFKQIDQDGDGMLDLDEFVAMIGSESLTEFVAGALKTSGGLKLRH